MLSELATAAGDENSVEDVECSEKADMQHHGDFFYVNITSQQFIDAALVTRQDSKKKMRMGKGPKVSRSLHIHAKHTQSRLSVQILKIVYGKL